MDQAWLRSIILWKTKTCLYFLFISRPRPIYLPSLSFLSRLQMDFSDCRHEKSSKLSATQNLNLTNFRKYTLLTTIVETIKFDWNNQTNQYNSHLKLFLDLQKVYQSTQLWLCIFIFQIYLNGAKIGIPHKRNFHKPGSQDHNFYHVWLF